MQILDIILYGENGEKRILPFEIGKVNIITGDSKTGKTQIINVVDYCMGSSFNIAEGVVRDYVFWYAVRYQLKDGQMLIARPNPTKYIRSGSDVFFQQADTVEIPDFISLVSNVSDTTLLLKLANIIGIEEYKHQADGFTRPDISVTFKHSRFYCFQPQTDIDQKDFLFYHQIKEDGRIAQAMKDTLAYFLGAVNNENVLLERQLAEKKRNLNRLEREIKDAQSIVDKTIRQVFELISEAKQVGLVSLNTVAKDSEEGLQILQILSEQDEIGDEQGIENEALSELLTTVKELVNQRSIINENIKSTETYQKENKGYESEVKQQVLRLESINLFSTNKDVNNLECPLCNQGLDIPIPTIKKINDSLIGLKTNLETTKKEQPRLKEYLDGLQKSKTEINSKIQELENSIKSIYKEKEQEQKLKDLNIRKGRVLGRISLYLESKVEVNDFSESKQKIEELKKEIQYLLTQLSREEIEEKLESILDQIGLQMTNWSQDLELEFKNRTLKFSIKKLTLFIISLEKTIPLDQTGSGENWVAYHLLIHFALHKFFILNKRPVPNFLILDQLSQAYFPPEKDVNKTGDIEQSEDDKAIKRLFEFIFKRTEELDGKLQTIIIDHAKLKDSYFQDAIKEEWRNGLKLVPIDWITGD